MYYTFINLECNCLLVVDLIDLSIGTNLFTNCTGHSKFHFNSLNTSAFEYKLYFLIIISLKFERDSMILLDTGRTRR